MFRKDLIELLLDRPMTISQIARQAREAPQDVEHDIEHVIQSLRTRNMFLK